MSVHIVYIMVNDKVPDLVKIGKTTTSVEQRSKELSRDTGVPGKWVPLKWWLVPDCHIAERHVHKELSAKRLQKNKEFFNFTGAEAVQQVHYHLARLGVVDGAGCEEYKKLKEEEARLAREKQKAEAQDKLQKERKELKRIELIVKELKRTHYETNAQKTLKETTIWVLKESVLPLLPIFVFFIFLMEPAFIIYLGCLYLFIPLIALVCSFFYIIITKGFNWDKQKELSNIAEQIKIVEAYLNQKTKEFNHST